jgi:hypothetical protein
MSSSSLDELSTTTGMVTVRGSARMRCSTSWPDSLGIFSELAAQLGVVGSTLATRVPEARAVVHHAQVAQLVGHHVVDHRQAEVDQPPVQADGAIGAGAAPAGAGADDRLSLRHCTPSCGAKVVQPLGEQALAPGASARPAPRRGSARAGGVRQAQVQRQARHAGQGLGVGVEHRAHVA